MKKDVLRNFEEFGRNIAVPPMPTLKFSNGGYFVYNGAVDVPFDNVKLVANMPTLRIGWVRYDCGFAVKSIMGEVSENFQPPRRGDLSDCDKSAWEEDEHGMPHDPWHAIKDVVVCDLDELDRGLLLTLDDNSDHPGIDWVRDWGRRIYETESLGILCQVYAAHARRAPDELPVIELTSHILFTHPTYGVVSIPQINVVGWWLRESIAAERAKRAEEAAKSRHAQIPRTAPTLRTSFERLTARARATKEY